MQSQYSPEEDRRICCLKRWNQNFEGEGNRLKYQND